MTDSHTLSPLSLATKTVTRMPEFTSSSNMTVVYTYTGGTAHIDCGVNLQGNKFSDSYYWEEWLLFWIEDSWFCCLLVGKKSLLLTCQTKKNLNWLLKEDEKEKGWRLPLLCLKFKVSTEMLEMCLTFIVKSKSKYEVLELSNMKIKSFRQARTGQMDKRMNERTHIVTSWALRSGSSQVV